MGKSRLSCTDFAEYQIGRPHTDLLGCLGRVGSAPHQCKSLKVLLTPFQDPRNPFPKRSRSWAEPLGSAAGWQARPGLWAWPCLWEPPCCRLGLGPHRYGLLLILFLIKHLDLSMNRAMFCFRLFWDVCTSPCIITKDHFEFAPNTLKRKAGRANSGHGQDTT